MKKLLIVFLMTMSSLVETIPSKSRTKSSLVKDPNQVAGKYKVLEIIEKISSLPDEHSGKGYHAGSRLKKSFIMINEERIRIRDLRKKQAALNK